MIIKPCDEDDKDSLQWSRIDKRNKVIPRAITAKPFTARLYKDMNWYLDCTFKMLGTLLKCGHEKQFVFDLMNAERYLSISKPTEDNPKRFECVAYMPKIWEESYGQSYEESKIPLVGTFEDVPDGYVKIPIPQLPSKKLTGSKFTEIPDLFAESNALPDTDKPNESAEEEK